MLVSSNGPPLVNQWSTTLFMSRTTQPGVTVGRILIQRDESLPMKLAVLFYTKLPTDITNYMVMLVDPMVATAGSAILATTVLQVPGRWQLLQAACSGTEGPSAQYLRVTSCSDPGELSNKVHSSH